MAVLPGFLRGWMLAGPSVNVRPYERLPGVVVKRKRIATSGFALLEMTPHPPACG